MAHPEHWRFISAESFSLKGKDAGRIFILYMTRPFSYFDPLSGRS